MLKHQYFIFNVLSPDIRPNYLLINAYLGNINLDSALNGSMFVFSRYYKTSFLIRLVKYCTLRHYLRVNEFFTQKIIAT
jgi:hypothetical protein